MPNISKRFKKIGEKVKPGFGYKAVEMGRAASTYAWMNEAIFDSLHYSSAVVVDLTALRNNCFMELGYALGRESRVILTAQKGTHIPFDSQAIDCHLWEDSPDNAQRISKFEEYWRRNIDRPPLVKPRRLL